MLHPKLPRNADLFLDKFCLTPLSHEAHVPMLDPEMTNSADLAHFVIPVTVALLPQRRNTTATTATPREPRHTGHSRCITTSDVMCGLVHTKFSPASQRAAAERRNKRGGAGCRACTQHDCASDGASAGTYPGRRESGSWLLTRK